MAAHTVFLFPGQGSYTPGVLHGLVDETVSEVLLRLDGVATEYGFAPISPLLTETGSPSLTQLVTDDPDRLQLASYATSVCLATLLETRYGIKPDLVFGHSFGEIAAFASAGFLTVENGMRVVCIRANELRRAGVADGGMVAVALNVGRLRHLLAAIDDPNLVLAAENAPQETIASGHTAALDGLERLAPALGVRATRLRVPYAFHSPLLAGPSRTLTAALRGIPIQYPAIRCWSDVLGRYLTDADDIPDLLARHLVEPVRFLAGVRELHANGGTRFIECGARDVLTRLVTAGLPPVTALAPLRKRTTFAELDTLLEAAPSAARAATTPAVAAAAIPATATARAPATAPAAAPAVATATAPAVVPTGAVATPPISAGNGARPADPFPELAARPAADATPPPAQPRLNAEDQLTEVRRFYAEALEYPESVVTPDAELEADLGIDSLKQNEVLAALLTKYGLADHITDVKATQYPTLNAIMELLQTLQPAATESPAAAPPDVVPPAQPSGNTQEQLAEIRRMYAEAMEYPESVVTPDAELEADLGIDSLKQNEILAAVLTRYGLADRAPEVQATQYPTLNAIMELLHNLQPAATESPAAAPPDVVAPAPAADSIPPQRRSDEGQLAEIRRMYAEAMEYPESVVTPDAELEADLGIDSLKQNEILAAVLTRYGLADRAPEVQATQYPTLNAIMELLQNLEPATAGK
ncbi:acyltransferase domain-containing protein [Amycolatopsis sp. NPDC088138]|uniref:acyltransferase domain-containing protein n=1 Tax=Amycolatopsis sp. NPDC088138 TaxID=3363938 RepID=UPI0037F5A4DD